MKILIDIEPAQNDGHTYDLVKTKEESEAVEIEELINSKLSSIRKAAEESEKGQA